VDPAKADANVECSGQTCHLSRKEMRAMSLSAHRNDLLFGAAGLALLGWLAGISLESAFFIGLIVPVPLMMLFMLAAERKRGKPTGRDSDRPEQPRGPTY
jgi:hypothetical protein